MTVLVVDDDALIRLFVSEILHDMNINVEALDSAESLIEYLTDSTHPFPELIILDVIMSGVDGFEAAAQVKAIAGDRHLPIIFLTGYKEPDVLSRCLSVGDDYIPKPFSVEMVTAKVRAHKRVIQLYKQLGAQYTELKRYHNQVSLEHDIVDSMFRRHIEDNFIESKLLRYHTSPKSLFNGDVLLFTYGPMGNLYILIGDVTGHGLPAAVGATPVFPAFFSMTRRGLGVGAIAAELNRALGKMLPDNMMMAACLMELNSAGNTLTVWSGGLPPALIVDCHNSIKQQIEPAHCPLAMLEEYEFKQDIRVYNVDIGDRVFLFTDGVEESRNQSGEFFGEERLYSLFEGGHDDVYGCILTELANFTRETAQDDDVTLVELTCQPTEYDEIELGCQEKAWLLPWSLNLTLEAQDIKRGNPVSHIVRLLSNAPGVDIHQDYISTILSELISNSLDHGLLSLDSSLKDTEDGFMEYYTQRKQRLEVLSDAYLTVTVELDPDPGSECNRVIVQVKDSGEGFHYHDVLSESNEVAHGRGLNIVRALCDTVEYSEGGTRVRAVYSL